MRIVKGGAGYVTATDVIKAACQGIIIFEDTHLGVTTMGPRFFFFESLT